MRDNAPKPDDDENELSSHYVLGQRPRVHYDQSNSNGNGANKIVWAVAGFAVVCLVTINGIMWLKLWDMSTSMTRLETRVEMVLDRLPQ